MKFLDKFKKRTKSDPNELWNTLSTERPIDRGPLQALTKAQLGELISQAQAAYRQGISADRAGEISISREFYRKAFTLLPTHTEALDNYAIGLAEELKFSEAIPFFEQSAVAEPNSPLAFVYLLKCYEETRDARKAEACERYLVHHWPDKSPHLDWSHLGTPQQRQIVAPPFAEGQVWRYKSRECDTNSAVWIKLVEPSADGNSIVHISVADVRAPDGGLMFISHLPYSASALLNCITSKCESSQTWNREDDKFGEGYGIWFEEFNIGKAGVFTAPLKEIIDVMLQNFPPRH